MQQSPIKQETPQPCIVIRFNHFDPIWQRCWDRDIIDQGRRIVSYRAIEEAWIQDALASCSDGRSCFMIEAPWVLRHYLDRHPEHGPVFRQLLQEGRFELLGSGENIVDTNMIHGELLCRNLILGTLWSEAALGQRPTSGWVQDTFGTSAQLPQIYRECGYRWLAWIIYVDPDRPYWRGLDGSVIFTHLEDKDRLATYMCAPGVKQQPCPDCRGKGCAACQQRGFRSDTLAEFARPPKERKPFEAGAMWLYGEETMPGRHVAEDIDRFMESQSQFAVRQGTFRDLGEYVANDIASVDSPPEDKVSSRVENNPVFTGCYVTRIRTKQVHRVAEHALLSAERWDTLLNNGVHADQLRALWRAMSLSAFHDSITGSHCDEAYDELMDLLRKVQEESTSITRQACSASVQLQPRAFTIFNDGSRSATAPVKLVIPERWEGAVVTLDSQPLPVYGVQATGTGTEISFLARGIPAFGAATVQLSPGTLRKETLSSAHCTGDRFAVTAGEHGISEMSWDGFGPVMDSRKYFLGELILEADHGGPWATFSPDRTRTRLGLHSRLQGVQASGDCTEITYNGFYPGSEDPFAPVLRWQQVFRLCKGLPWLDVETKVEWHTMGCRLRLAFPSTTSHNRGVYEIPYGILERERYDLPNKGYEAGGDWPALHWGGIQAPDHLLAVFNQGTPSYRAEDGTLMISVLRSPRWYEAVRPATPGPVAEDEFASRHYYGRLDHGTHVFRHAVYAVSGHWRNADVVWQAHLFNSRMHVQPGAMALN